MTRGAITWGPAAIWAAVLFLLSSTSDIPGASWLPVSDKVLHLIAYTVLGAALAWGRFSGDSRLPHVAFIAVGMLYGLSDEWHQSFVPGRDASVGDLVADTGGVLLGYSAASLALSRARARKALSRG